MGRQAVAYVVKSKNSYHYFVLTILKEEGNSMTPMQLLDKIRKLKKITGKTPDATIRSILQRSSYIEKDGRKHYKLKPGIRFPILK